MLRVPFSTNSKNGQQVRIIQKWNGFRPKINPILFDFYIYIANKQLQLQQQQQRYQQHKSKLLALQQNQNSFSNDNPGNIIGWIEKLLDNGLKDYRKYTITFILAPYLINVKNQSYGESFSIIQNWLYSKCIPQRPLDNPRKDFDRRIKDSIESCIKKGWRPTSLDKLKLRNKELHEEILSLLFN
jgi:hypothetical protein